MKRIILLFLAVCILAVAGCSTTQDTTTADSQKSSIESVLTQRAKIEKEQISSLRGEHVAELMAIDVQGCPADFRSAWFDYLVAAQNLHTRVERVASIGLAVGKPVTNVPTLIKFAANSPEAGRYLLEALGKVDDAWTKVERVALNYGVIPLVDGGDTGHPPNTALEATPHSHCGFADKLSGGLTRWVRGASAFGR